MALQGFRNYGIVENNDDPNALSIPNPLGKNGGMLISEDGNTIWLWSDVTSLWVNQNKERAFAKTGDLQGTNNEAVLITDNIHNEGRVNLYATEAETPFDFDHVLKIGDDALTNQHMRVYGHDIKHESFRMAETRRQTFDANIEFVYLDVVNGVDDLAPTAYLGATRLGAPVPATSITPASGYKFLTWGKAFDWVNQWQGKNCGLFIQGTTVGTPLIIDGAFSVSQKNILLFGTSPGDTQQHVTFNTFGQFHAYQTAVTMQNMQLIFNANSGLLTAGSASFDFTNSTINLGAAITLAPFYSIGDGDCWKFNKDIVINYGANNQALFHGSGLGGVYRTTISDHVNTFVVNDGGFTGLIWSTNASSARAHETWITTMYALNTITIPSTINFTGTKLHYSNSVSLTSPSFQANSREYALNIGGVVGATYDVNIPSQRPMRFLQMTSVTADGTYVTKKKLVVNELGEVIPITDTNQESVTYAQLVTKINASTLVAGTQYEINDFQVRHYLVDNNFGQDIAVQFTGTLEPLVVTAISTNAISKEAYSPLFPNDIIHYDWNPENWKWDMGYGDLTTDDANPTIIPNWKGVIHFRHTTINNNYAGYDIRNVKFRRYKQKAVVWDGVTTFNLGDKVQYLGFIYTSIKGTNLNNDPSASPELWVQIIDLSITEYINVDKTNNKGIPSDPLDFQDFLTFVPNGNTYEYGFKNNELAPFRDDYLTYSSDATTLPNTVFFANSNGLGAIGVNVGNYWNHNTFVGTIVYCQIGDYCNNNTIGNNYNNNTIGSNYYNNIIGNDYGYNIIGTSYYYNIIGNNYNYNTIGNDYSYNTIGNNYYYNTIGNNYNNNTIGNNYNYNTIGSNYYYNIIGNNYNNSTIGNSYYYNTIGNNYNNNTIGNSYYYNTIGNNYNNNTIGNNYSYNLIIDNYQMNTVQDNASNLIDYTLATHVYQLYNTTTFKNSTFVARLSYYDGSDVLTIVNPNG